MEHIESTSRKETRFPSKYATNLGSIHPRLLLPSTIRFSQRLSPKTFRQPLFMKSIIQVWNRSYFREKNSTIFLFSMIYKCLLGQGIENTVNTVDALYIYIYYVLIKYRYRFIVYTCRFKFRRISLWSFLYNSLRVPKNRDSSNALILKGKSILLNSCRSSLCV